MRFCKRCGENKDELAFYKAKNRKDGVALYCKKCSDKLAHDWRKRNKSTHTIYYHKNLEKRRQDSYASSLKRNYKMSLDDYHLLLSNQGNRCAICGSYEQKLNVDHDHISGKVRGLLCGPCNRGIGQLKDNIQILENAIKYLKM